MAGLGVIVYKEAHTVRSEMFQVSIGEMIRVSGLGWPQVHPGCVDLAWCKLRLEVLIYIQPEESSLSKSISRVWRQATDGCIVISDQMRLFLSWESWTGVCQKNGLASVEGKHFSRVNSTDNISELWRSYPTVNPGVLGGRCVSQVKLLKLLSLNKLMAICTGFKA